MLEAYEIKKFPDVFLKNKTYFRGKSLVTKGFPCPKISNIKFYVEQY